MKKLFACFAVALLSLFTGNFSQASTINFLAKAYRGGSTTGTLPTITENATQNGFRVTTTEGGQKAFYGTDFFNGWSLNQIQSLEFTFKNTNTSTPYSNLIITDGSGAYGVISSNKKTVTDVISTQTSYQATVTYSFVGVGNTFNFYEPVNASWTHGSTITWDQISNWTLLGIGATRPLFPGSTSKTAETETDFRAPRETALNIIWGDSEANYIGTKEIWDVSVTTVEGEIYTAGAPVPEPATMALFSLGLLGLAGISRRKNR